MPTHFRSDRVTFAPDIVGAAVPTAIGDVT